ncbi:Major Facilitator Superfamily protein [Fervidobacterium changbaicum]|uniref:MFS transporter n=1 Tax=Fervidobacterium changbaicum TaxID=310769 RepID=A0ABX5QST3_9BACT|nr:MFS transporter [Fervidobacterium changbaicum]QAV33348.1 MFS transporter [Fervidobacterium changbaicum]SDG89336.1 Major Facilitator Superfamily protein [Fervidobacterium changbaicum]
MGEDIYRYERRNLALIVTGRFESLLGAAALLVAMPLYILDKTNSGMMMSIFTILGILSRLITTPIGGVLGDRINRKAIMVLLDELRGILLFATWLIAINNKLSVAVLLVFRAILSFLDGLFDGPTSAMFGDVVRKENMKRATSLNALANSGANIIGPIVGSMLYGYYGLSNVLLLTALLYILSGISEMFIIYKHVPRDSKIKFLSEISEGIKFVFTRRGLTFLFTFAIVINFLMSPLFSVAFPYIVRSVLKFSPTQFGTLEVFATVGALVGNFAIMFFLHKLSSKTLISSGLMLEQFLMVVLSIIIMPYFHLDNIAIYIVFAVVIFTTTFLNVLVNVPIISNLQILVPSQLRSRVFSILTLFAMGSTPISSALYGYLLDKVNPFWLFFAVNVISTVVIIAFLLNAPEDAYDPNLANHEA